LTAEEISLDNGYHFKNQQIRLRNLPQMKSKTETKIMRQTSDEKKIAEP